MLKPILFDIISTDYESEYQIAGHDMVEQIIDYIILSDDLNSDDLFTSTGENGRNFDFEFSIKIISEVVTIGKVVFELYNLLKKEKNAKPTTEIIKYIIDKLPNKRKNLIKDKEKLINDILQEIESKK